LQYKRIPFDKPRYVPVDTLPFIPLESEIDQLISGVGSKTAVYLQLLKETGARAGEAWNLRWIDINPEAGTVTITPEKGSRARHSKVTGSLVVMLNRQPHLSEYVFRSPSVDSIDSLDNFSRNFSKQRRKISEKLQNPRILRISFRTFPEHWAYADSVLLSRKPFNGYLWLLVGMSIENYGYDRIPMDWNNFVVVMSHGGKKHQFNAHSPTRSFSQPLLTNDILNGLTAYGYLIYEIPGNFDPTKYTLLYKPQSGNYDVRYANRGVQIRLSRADSDRSI
jgi:hypothetical protein